MSDATLAPPRPTIGDAVATRGVGRWFRNPWRKPRVLEAITWAYLAWSILPVVIAVVFSFNDGRSRSAWQGFSLQWWVGDPGEGESLWYNRNLRAGMYHSVYVSAITMAIAVPLGVAFAIGLDRWRGRVAGSANFAMMFSFVIPELILGVSLYIIFSYLFRGLVFENWLGGKAQILGLITFQLSYPVIIVRARLLGISKEYEEAAMDLGATPTQAVRRVLLPLLYPAIFASFAIVFADSIDDFVTVRYLASTGAETLSMQIYSAARSSPTPAVNAAATAMLISTLTVITIGVIAYRILTRGQRRKGESAARDFAAFEL